MAQKQSAESEVRVSARNIGGIDETDVTLPPGVTVLSGRNATNRTSFLQAIMAGLGSERSTLKGDADEGEVRLEIGGDEYHRTLQRRGPNVVYDGDPYLDDPELADLFAFLLENNEARQAVARGDDLREIIMRPIDTDRIDAEIDELEREKRDLDDRIRELERSEDQLTDLEARRHELEGELADVREEHAEVQAAIDDLDVDLEESRSRKAEIEDAFEELREARAELDDLEFDLDTERSTLQELESERAELEERLEKADDEETDPARLGGRIEELRRRKRSLDDTLSELQSVISFNEELLEEDGLSVDPDADDDSAGADALTNELLDGDRTICWTCGSEVDRESIADTVDQLRDLRTEKLGERNELRDEIEELSDRKAELEERRREREQAERRLDEVEDQIAATEERIATLESDREEQVELVESLEADAEQLGGEYDEVLEKHREANELELRIESLEDDLASVEEEIEAQESTAEQLDALRDDREELTDRLEELRTRVDRIEADAVESFNDHIESVLDILEYENIERIWIERREREVREGRRTVERTEFDLHVIRSSDDGATYRDTVDHLSESEREVTGLVFALAGYLVHDVHEEVPFIILDSLEAIDSRRIARVVDYFQEYVGYLTVALLPEDAQALSDSYEYVHDVN